MLKPWEVAHSQMVAGPAKRPPLPSSDLCVHKVGFEDNEAAGLDRNAPMFCPTRRYPQNG